MPFVGGLDITVSRLNSSFGSSPVYSNRLLVSRFVALSHWCLLTLKGTLRRTKQTKEIHTRRGFFKCIPWLSWAFCPSGKGLFHSRQFMMLDWGKLVRHLDLCHYTPPRSPSVCCLLCLLEDRSLSCTVQSHYGLSVTPSFLLGCSQEGIKGIRYRSVSAKFWLTKDKDKHMQACMLEHTYTRWLQTCCQNWRRVIHCYGDKEVAWYSGACGDVTAPCLWLAFLSERWEIHHI